MNYCNNCGAKLDNGQEYCSKCGTKIVGNIVKEKKKVWKIILDVIRYILAVLIISISVYYEDYRSIIFILAAIICVPFVYDYILAKMKIKYWVQIIITILAIIITVVANQIFYFDKSSDKIDITAYYLNASTYYLKIYESGVQLEDVGNEINTYWNNQITTNTYGDIDSAVENALKDNSDSVDSIKNYDNEIEEIYKKLLITPDECKYCSEVKDSAKEVYNAYQNLHDLVLYPSGNYLEFKNSLNEYDNNLSTTLSEYSVLTTTYNN